MAKVQVRVKMFPNPIEVDDSELPNLRSQGLLVDETEALIARREALAVEMKHIDDELSEMKPADTPPADTPPAESAPKPAAKPAAAAKKKES